MIDPRVTLKALAVAALAFYATSPSAQELSDDPEVLLDQLADEADPAEGARLAAEVLERWSHSGSAAMDLLLRRAQDAMADDDYVRAVAHLTALTDHAPDFAEGWNKRAEAFFMMEQYGAALTDIEQALILQPRHFGAWAGLGIMLDRMDRKDAALRAFRRAEELYPAEENVAGAVERLELETGGRTL
ncbi:hypothetical protein [Jannaschia sp. W003]|uniref:hypothetical protein n=1 Tax=Jannaschia sp. W003 TaxID=2867012 RepID=UPI0021A2D268|nr:hypothetical protein [Jannaschia sp. W003]UWQ20638.1 hypothetical protein K3554_11685 [Jannaschia sp. W003]